MTPVEFVKFVAKEFVNVDDVIIEGWLEVTSPLVSKSAFAEHYNIALAYMTAHKMKMSGLGENQFGTIADTLNVASISEGEQSISFVNNGANKDSELSLTIYGAQFITLRNTCIIPVII